MAKRKGKRGGKGKGAKKKHGAGHKPAHYLTKCKLNERKSLQLDQIHENFEDAKVVDLIDDAPINDDLPGGGQNYCLHCE